MVLATYRRLFQFVLKKKHIATLAEQYGSWRTYAPSTPPIADRNGDNLNFY